MTFVSPYLCCPLCSHVVGDKDMIFSSTVSPIICSNCGKELKALIELMWCVSLLKFRKPIECNQCEQKFICWTQA